MLAMVEIQYIKHLRDKEGKCIQSTAKNLNINWRAAGRRFGLTNRGVIQENTTQNLSSRRHLTTLNDSLEEHHMFWLTLGCSRSRYTNRSM